MVSSAPDRHTADGCCAGEVQRLRDEIERLRAELDGLHIAFDSRGTIEQAKGVLMALNRVPAEDAFALLIERSQRTNRRLRELARDLVDWAAGERVSGPPV